MSSPIAVKVFQENPTATAEITTTKPPIAIDNGKGALIGQLIRPEFWNDVTLYAYAAPYLGDPEGEGIFILDDKLNVYSKIFVDNTFEIIDIPPGIYILVVGPDVETAIAYRKDGIAIKVSVDENQISDLGVITLE
ncbi:MAG: hypothetical protein WBI14_05285 [Anaerolineaceae bacterium]